MRFLTALLPLTTLALHVAATDLSPNIPLGDVRVVARPQPVHLPPAQAGDLEAQQSSPAQRPCGKCIQKAKEIVRAKKQATRELSARIFDSLQEYYAVHPEVINTGIGTCFIVGVGVIFLYEEMVHHGRRRGESVEHGSLPDCQPLDCSTVCATKNSKPAKRDTAKTVYRRRLELD
ncbi:hypothetical protein F5050DRAFT_1806756 [Lentinula boryana]|uniref:Uncharacterized protein n=1 Tax=Lentinula boryana TaxID=40481 RepID=A0ABQ8QGI7_9AGAR|nr:hypothetical protein F5050DRAFT_1806756 [Lentinula boryana]